MPIYDLECKKCSNSFEQHCSVSDRHVIPCPECNGDTFVVINYRYQPVVRQSYFDSSLGVTVESASHRRQLMKERDLVEVGGCNAHDVVDSIKPPEPDMPSEAEIGELIRDMGADPS